ncbi:alpha-amylase family glycosyl hydrolase [Anaerotalea alkaliphila]|uniref:Alpha-amylase n=1 Tax=Anaerotalea alkaliphila TaxID=2662126 RepID=A0A7X5HY99_9FIRM|nr:alpha-amylase family glycosyl hydrolase [Anaerotalea alkaliphila]NDL68826.1 alpha-amylase [Anaerotalea alkaliphila]
MEAKARMKRLWREIFGEGVGRELLEGFLEQLDRTKETHFSGEGQKDTDWYKDAVVYSTYGDLFNKDLLGLSDKLDHLQELGINCIWLLPVLESPMKDAGFDISDFSSIRSELLGLPEGASPEEKDRVFAGFIQAAHARGIRVIFDIAINHCSMEHPWFQEARRSKDSPKRDWFIWSDTTDRYKEARIIFKGMCKSNWEWDETAGQYYFHRFFEIQPDLNYRNPELLLAMVQVLVDWKVRGIDGFRADAVPYLWKEEGTNCENLPGTHLIVKFFRAALDFLEEGTLVLAEACQPPVDVVEYFGENDECHAAYHFPVMPRIYKALAEGRKDSIEMVMDPSFTPPIPGDCQWFMFLRCHDELTLEMVTPEEREFIYKAYVKDPLWDFRQGEGISARLAELFEGDIRRIRLAYSIMFTLLGTPIIYYGDEFGKGNDLAYYQEVYAQTGYPDTRYLVRGRIDWDQVEAQLGDPASLGHQIYHTLKRMVAVRGSQKAFARGDLRFLELGGADGAVNSHVLAYERAYGKEQAVVLQNLTGEEQTVEAKALDGREKDLLGQEIRRQGGLVVLPPYGFHWC